MAELLEGRVARVLWSAPDTGYAIVRLDTGDEPVTVVGNILSLVEEGAFLSLEGRFEDHPVHGRQFRALGGLPALPRTLRGMEQYIAHAGAEGVGIGLAKRIVREFGMDLPKILSAEPERVGRVKGIGAKRAAAIAEKWAEDEAERNLSVILRGLGLSARLIERIRRAYGGKAAHIVQNDPYRLAEDISGIGFKTADSLARQLGLPADHPGRAEAAVLHVLAEASSEGDCYLPLEVLSKGVVSLGIPLDQVAPAVDARERSGRLVVDGDRVYLAALYRAEAEVAFELSRRQGGGDVDPDEVVRAARFEGVDLDPRQQDAVLAALRGGVVVITGGPGTGKTTLVRVLVRAVHERGETWKLASPTGRAARRLEEATGREASTLHRLLEYRPGEGGFQRGVANPIEADGLVVDEVSMVDLPLAAALLAALPPDGFSLVLVGDADQLPSVGPGQLLRDLIASGTVPVVRLERVFRQAAESGIIQAASRVLAGDVPPSGENAGWSDFFVIRRDDGEAARHTLVSVVAERLAARGFDPMSDVQVLAPMRKGPVGTEELNRALQARLNPNGAVIERSGALRAGDRVLCTKNRYDLDVFNGDVGRVRLAGATGLDVDFDGRVVTWPWDDLDQLELAYALTVHKAQGSEYPAVVLALHSSQAIMLRRNLLYTAITRAKRFLCVVGDPGALRRAVTSVGGDERFTALAERLARP